MRLQDPPDFLFNILRTQFLLLKHSKYKLAVKKKAWEEEDKLSITLEKTHAASYNILQAVNGILQIDEETCALLENNSDIILKRLYFRRKKESAFRQLELFVRLLSGQIGDLRRGILNFHTHTQKNQREFLRNQLNALLEPNSCEYCSKPVGRSGHISILHQCPQCRVSIYCCESHSKKNEQFHYPTLCILLQELKSVNVDHFYEVLTVPVTDIEESKDKILTVLEDHFSRQNEREAIYWDLRKWIIEASAAHTDIERNHQEKYQQLKKEKYVTENSLQRMSNFLEQTSIQKSELLKQMNSNAANGGEGRKPLSRSLSSSKIMSSASAPVPPPAPTNTGAGDFSLNLKLIELVTKLKHALKTKDLEYQKMASELSQLKAVQSIQRSRFDEELLSQKNLITALENKAKFLQDRLEEAEQRPNTRGGYKDPSEKVKIVFDARNKFKTSTAMQTDVPAESLTLRNWHRRVSGLKEQLQDLRSNWLVMEQEFYFQMLKIKQYAVEKSKDYIKILDVDPELDEKHKNIGVQTEDHMMVREGLESRGTQVDSSVLDVLTCIPADSKPSTTVNCDANNKGDAVMLVLSAMTINKKLQSHQIAITKEASNLISPAKENPAETPRTTKKKISLRTLSFIARLGKSNKQQQEGQNLGLSIQSLQPPQSNESIDKLNYENVDANEFIRQYLCDERELRRMQAIDNWMMFGKLSRLQIWLRFFDIDNEYINFDMNKRARILINLYMKAHNLLRTWRIRRQLFTKVRRKLQDCFKTFAIDYLYKEKDKKRPQSARRNSRASLADIFEVHSPRESTSTYKSNDLLRFLMPDPEHDSPALYTGLAVDSLNMPKEEQPRADSLVMLSKDEVIRLDALAPLISYNFSAVDVNLRKQIISDIICYVVSGQSENDSETKLLIEQIQLKLDSSKYKERLEIRPTLPPRPPSQTAKRRMSKSGYFTPRTSISEGVDKTSKPGTPVPAPLRSVTPVIPATPKTPIPPDEKVESRPIAKATTSSATAAGTVAASVANVTKSAHLLVEKTTDAKQSKAERADTQEMRKFVQNTLFENKGKKFSVVAGESRRPSISVPEKPPEQEPAPFKLSVITMPFGSDMQQVVPALDMRAIEASTPQPPALQSTARAQRKYKESIRSVSAMSSARPKLGSSKTKKKK